MTQVKRRKTYENIFEIKKLRNAGTNAKKITIDDHQKLILQSNRNNDSSKEQVYNTDEWKRAQRKNAKFTKRFKRLQ
jgi:hypothetical protein